MNHHERYKATEILFQPKHIGVDGKGIAEMTFNSIEKCDGDLQINLYNNIVLAGGSTLLNGFQSRFEDEIIKHAEKSKCKTDINVYGDMHRKNAAWIGGSMISSFSTFKDMVITGDEYRENVENERSSCVHKKSIN
jgi:actin-related protein